MALLPPGGLPEIVFSFDTTGSMSSCLTEVRGRLQDMIQRLQADIPAIRIAVFAHGDYCDKHNYVTKWIDFSTDVTKLCDFVNNVSSTGGGDSDECYELVLRQVGEELSWTPNSNRALVMIGDANPHGPDYPDNTLKIDWRNEVKTLNAKGVKIYGVQCKGYTGAKDFYQTISEQTGGRHLQLDKFSNVFDFLMAICYREHGVDMLDIYEKEVRARCGDGTLSSDMEGMFSTLRDPVTSLEPEPEPESEPAVEKTVAKKPTKKVPVLKKIKSDIKAGKGKPKTVSKPRIKSLKKAAMLTLPLLRREEVPENNFMLRDKEWSSWTKVIAPEVPANQSEDLWQKRRGDGNGYRTKNIFNSNNSKPALYELSVQNQRYGRKFVMFQKYCRFIPSNVSWESRLLGNAAVRAQVNSVVSQGCSVFVRRVVYRTANTHTKTSAPSLKSYDYAWRQLKKERSRPRLVIKQGKTISMDTL